MLGIVVLCGCESKETKLKKDYSTFLQWQYNNCLCLMGSLPRYTSALLAGASVEAFCRHSTNFCINMKTPEQISHDAAFMRNLGDYRCTPDYFKYIHQQFDKHNFESKCWNGMEDMVVIARFAGVTTLCESKYGKSGIVKVDCDCVAVEYLNSLSEEEKTELQKANLLFPGTNGYGWKNNTPKKQKITKSIMQKMDDAISKCTRR